MSEAEYSRYQRDIINRYYENLDAIMLQKLQELVSELYLADTDAKKKRLWQRVAKAMGNLKIPEPIAAHILEKRSVEILARNLEDWLSRAGKK